MKKRIFTALITITFFSGGSVFATNGYFPHGWGMKSKGMAGVGVALPQDSIAASQNPAGMALIGKRADFGIDIFAPDRSAEITGNTLAPDQQADGNGDTNFLVPEFGYNSMISDTMSVGVSVFGNGGMNTSYENGILLFNGGAGETGINLQQLFIAPTLAVIVNDKHALGVSLNLAYQTFEAKGLTSFTGASQAPTAVADVGEDSSTGVGLSIGWNGEITPELHIAAAYRTKTEMSEFDKYEGLFAEQGKLDIPSMYGLGLSYKVSPQFLVAFDITGINYSDSVSNSNSATQLIPGGQPLGSNDGPGFGWDDITVFKLGVSYKVNDQWLLRGGWNRGDNPIPEGEAMFNVLAPGVMEDHLTLGATWTLGSGMEVTFAYMYAPEVEVKGQNSIPPGAPPAGFGGGEANIKMSQNSFGVAFGWNLK